MPTQHAQVKRHGFPGWRLTLAQAVLPLLLPGLVPVFIQGTVGLQCAAAHGSCKVEQRLAVCCCAVLSLCSNKKRMEGGG